MTKPSDHVVKAMAYQAEADLLMREDDFNELTGMGQISILLSAIESRLAALTEATLATIGYPILGRVERDDSV